MFASSLISQVSGNDGISDSYDIIVYKGSSFIIAAFGCGLAGVVATLSIYANIAGKKVPEAPVNDYYPVYNNNPYDEDSKPINDYI